jgi:chromosome segregation ATPase
MPMPTENLTTALRDLAHEGLAAHQVGRADPCPCHLCAEQPRIKAMLEEAADQLEQLEGAIALQHSLWREQRAVADAWRLCASEQASLRRGIAEGWSQPAIDRAQTSASRALRRALHLDGEQLEVEVVEQQATSWHDELGATVDQLEQLEPARSPASSARQALDQQLEQLERRREGEAGIDGELQP